MGRLSQGPPKLRGQGTSEGDLKEEPARQEEKQKDERALHRGSLFV